MLDPCFLIFTSRLDAVCSDLAHMCQTLGNPVGVMLTRKHHVADDRWAARASDDEQVRKIRNRYSEVGARPLRPFFTQGIATDTANIHR